MKMDTYKTFIHSVIWVGTVSLIGLGTGFWIVNFGRGNAIASPIPDGTLGAERTQVVQQDALTDRIEGGAIRHHNLFHSFEEFSIDAGRGAYFANPDGIANIFSRVTGSKRSDILGRLGVLGDANLFLINPNGILFGPDATLDMRGAFHASTANEIIFPDGNTFSALAPDAAPLLTVDVTVPLSVEFAGATSGVPVGDLTNDASLTVDAGQRLTLQGDTVISRGELLAPGGTVQVLGNRVGLTNQARIDVSSSTGGGTVQVGGAFQGNDSLMAAARTYVGEDVEISADALTSGDGGEVIIWADEVTGFSGTVTARGGSNNGNGGFVEVSGKETLLFEGNVDVNAVNGAWGTLLLDPRNITISNQPSSSQQVDASLPTIFEGDFVGDNIVINSQNLVRQSGNIKLEATNDIQVDDTLSLDFGGGGSITLIADSDQDGSGSFSMGTNQSFRTDQRDLFIQGVDITMGAVSLNGGNANLTASRDINIASNFLSDADSNLEFDDERLTFKAGQNMMIDGRIDGDFISIETGGDLEAQRIDSDNDNLQIKSEGNISATRLTSSSAFGAGDISLDAGGQILLDEINASPGKFGDRFSAGNVTLTAGGDITVTGEIRAISEGQTPGSVEINSANGNVSIGSISTFGRAGFFDDICDFLFNVCSDSSEDAGQIDIRSFGSIDIDDINATSEDKSGGDVQLFANDEITVTGVINTSGGSDGQGGNITIGASDPSVNSDLGVPNTIDVNELTSNRDADFSLTANGAINTGMISLLTGDSSLLIQSNSSGIQTGTLNISSNTLGVELDANSYVDIQDVTIFGTAPLTLTVRNSGSDISSSNLGVQTGSILTEGGRITVNNQSNGDVEINTATLSSSGGNIALTSGGNLNVLGNITSSGGNISIETQNEGSVAVDGFIQSTSPSIGGAITLESSGTIAVGGDIDADASTSVTGDVLISNGIGNLTLGSIQADDLTVESAGTIVGNGVLTVQGDASFTSRSLIAGTVEITNTTDTTIGSSIIGGDLVINSSGPVTQSSGAIVQVAGSISGDEGGLTNSVSSGPGPIWTTLDDGSVIITAVGPVDLGTKLFPVNLTVNSLPRGVTSFGGVLTPTAIELNQANQFAGVVRLNTEVHPNSVVTTATPGIIQSGPVTVVEDTVLNSDGGNIALNDSGNDFNAIAFQGNDVSITDQGGLSLLDSQVDGNLDLVTTGVLSQTEPISVDGATQLETTLLRAGNVTLTNVEPTQLDTLLIGGDFTLNALGGIPQIPQSSIQIAGDIGGIGSDSLNRFIAGADLSITIDPNSPMGSQDVVITAVGTIDVSDALRELELPIGNLTVTSLKEAIQFAEVFDNEAITLNQQNRFGGPLNITTDASTITQVTATPEIIQSDPISVIDTASFRAEGGSVTLNEAANQFGQLSVRSDFGTLTEQDATQLTDSRIEENFTLTSGGDVTQTNALIVDGDTQITLTQPNTRILLLDENQLNGTVALNNTGGGVSALNTVTNINLAESNIGGRLILSTSETIRQEAPITVAGRTILQADGTVLPLDNDFNRVIVKGGDRLILNDINDLRIRNSRVISRGSAPGTIRLRAEGQLILNGNEFLIGTATDEGNDIRLRAEHIQFRNGNVILSVARGIGRDAGQAGDLVLNADQISFTDNRPITVADDIDDADTPNNNVNVPNLVGSISFDDGQPGDVVIRTQDLIVDDGSIITTATLGTQKGGNVNIDADRIVVRGINGETLPSIISADTFGAGAGGTVNIIDADQLILEEGSLISASTFSRGTGGNIVIDASHVQASGQATSSPNISSGISARSFSRGEGGSIEVIADSITLTDTGVIGVSSRRPVGALEEELTEGDRDFREQLTDIFEELEEVIPEAKPTRIAREDENAVLDGSPGNEPGDAGDIFLTANRISLDNAEIFARSKAEADGGNIVMTVADLLELRFNSLIETQAGRDEAPGNGGDITINADNGFIFGVREEDSDIAADAFTGDGGNVTIITQEIFGLKFRDERTIWSDITASSTLGRDGEVLIDRLNVDLIRGLVPLPDQPVDPDITDTCRASGSAEAVEFFMVGRGALHPHRTISSIPVIF